MENKKEDKMTDKKKMRYFISVDLYEAIEAESEEEAYKIANRHIKDKCYSLNIVDREEIEDDDEATCLECGKRFEQDRDIQLCDKCMKLFDTDKLWDLHDRNIIDALDFNENRKMMENFRK